MTRRYLSQKAIERVKNLVNHGEGRCTLWELRRFIQACLGPDDQLADDAEISMAGGRRLIVRDGWVTAERVK